MNNIRKFRNELELSQENLSTMTNLSIGYICHLEKGSRTNPSMNTILKICSALGKNKSEIFPD
ncbi:MAG: helix-turn-helix transcriptional regulator [Clostridia bacterium]